MLGGRLLVAVMLLGLAAPVAHAEPIAEKYKIPTVDGAEINVEVMRPEGDRRAPVILTYSPYNTLGEGTSPNLANDGLGEKYLPLGYARAVADVLGTRNSSGCWDYGGADEQQSGVDLVNFLAAQPWSNGKVAMIGGSYDGTTANMVAARGRDAPGLKAIVPEAAISRWYGYAYGDGVRYFLNSEVATDEGFDTPLLFDFGLARTPPTDPGDPLFGDKLASRANPCESAQHTVQGYDRTPDYDDFWLERDYLKDAANFRAAVLLAHGWQDYNVKQDEGIRLFEALGDKVPFKRAFLFQGPHASPSGETWDALLDAFFERTLMGVKNGVQKGPAVITEGRTVGDGGYESTGFREEASWPPAGTEETTLWLRRTFDQDVPGVELPPPSSGETGVLAEDPNTEETDNVFTWVDTGTSTEEISTNDPSNEPGHGYYSLYFKTEPLEAATRLAGRAVLDAIVRNDQGGAHLTPILVDVAPDGTLRTIARGFLNLDYRNGLEAADPAPGEWVEATVRFLPQDFTFQPGHRIGLIAQSSNTVWALPGAAGTANILTGPLAEVSPVGSSLSLPISP
ncbi:MAG: CocE/NonD family hydrolase [Thermoleophilaceae bacterium]